MPSPWRRLRLSFVTSLEKPLSGVVAQAEGILERFYLGRDIGPPPGLPVPFAHPFVDSAPTVPAESASAVAGTFLVAGDAAAFHVLESPRSADVKEFR